MKANKLLTYYKSVIAAEKVY